MDLHMQMHIIQCLLILYALPQQLVPKKFMGWVGLFQCDPESKVRSVAYMFFRATSLVCLCSPRSRLIATNPRVCHRH